MFSRTKICVTKFDKHIFSALRRHPFFLIWMFWVSLFVLSLHPSIQSHEARHSSRKLSFGCVQGHEQRLRVLEQVNGKLQGDHHVGGWQRISLGEDGSQPQEPPLLHGQSSVCRYRGSYRQIPSEVRKIQQEGIQRLNPRFAVRKGLHSSGPFFMR